MTRDSLAFGVVLATVALDAIGIGLIFPVMPGLLEELTGRGLSEAALWGGLITTSFAVMQFLCGPLVGNLSDRFGRRPVLLTSLTVMALDYVVLAVAGSVWLLLAGRVVNGITSATHATANAFVADITAPDDRARRFGLVGAAFGAGFVAGPLLGGLLATLDLRAPFWAAAGLAALNAGVGAFVLPESLPADRRRPFRLASANPFGALRELRRLPGLHRLIAVAFLYALGFNVWPAIWSYYGAAAFGWDAWWIGLSLAVFGLAMAITQATAVGPVIRLLGERRALFWGLWLEVGTLVFYGFTRSGFWAMAFTPVSALGGIVSPALNALMSRAVPETEQGALQGVLASANALAMILSPLVMTATFGAFTRPGAAVFLPGAPFLVAAALTVACLLILVAQRPDRRESAP